MYFNNREQEAPASVYRDITFQVTGDCNLACSYCYQHSKNHEKMSFETAKKCIDKILTNDQDFWNGYIQFDDKNLTGMYLQFIGGEPLLEDKLILKIIDYYAEACKRFGRERLFKETYFGICTNGTIYNETIEEMIRRYPRQVNISISIDGNKELHDKCRRYKGSNAPSYDVVVKNLERFRKILPPCNRVNTKATISPDNLPYISESVKVFFDDLKFKVVPMNCVYEDVWSVEDAKRLYQELKKVADWMLATDYNWGSIILDPSERRDDTYQLGFFSESAFRALDEGDLKNSWCGGNGRMLFMQYDGKFYNCNRYSEISVGNKERDLHIGNVNDGITQTENVCLLKGVCRGSIMDDECKACPIAAGCSDCLAYYYEKQGEFKKIKSLCDMHKARCLANVYYWNKQMIKNGDDRVFAFPIPFKEALKYVDIDELQMLWKLSNGRLLNGYINGEGR